MEHNNAIVPRIVLDYVDLIIRKMKYSRKVRHDVRAELLAHFEDALRNVDNEQDRQKKAEELIHEFGDAKLLATLIRRGKKRCRPTWQKALIHIFQTACVLFLLLILYIGWFFTGKPAITANYMAQMNQLVRPIADDSQNAWPLYQAAVKEYKIADANDFYLSPHEFSILNDAQRRIVEKWIADNQKAMELVRQGAQKPYYWQVYSTGNIKQDGVPKMMEMFVPNLSEAKKLSQILCWDAYLKADKEDHTGAFDELLTAYTFGRHIKGYHTLLIEQLVGIVIEAETCRTLIAILSDYKVDSNVLASAQQKLERIIKTEDGVSFKGEKLCMYDELQRCFTQNHIGKSHLYLRRLMELDSEFRNSFYIGPRNALHILFTHPNRRKTREGAEQIYKIYDEMATLTPVALNKRPEFNKQIEEISRGNLLLTMMAPAVAKVIEISSRNQMFVRATVAVIAIHRYKQDTGQFPISLQDVIQKGYLKEIPVDVYSDQPIAYKQEDEDFILYSVGPDYNDNNGLPIEGEDYWAQKNKDRDIIFWPVYKKTSDAEKTNVCPIVISR